MRRRLLDHTYKKTVTGNPAIAKSVARMYPDISFPGKTEQQQTYGYQLFDASKLPTKSQGGATVTNNDDGGFTISGSGNLTEMYINQTGDLTDVFRKLLKPGALKLIVENTVPEFFFSITYAINGENTGVQLQPRGSTSIEITQDIINGLKLCYFGFADGSGKGITPTKIKPILFQDGDGTWEPYTGGKPSPSPEYKQDIVNTQSPVQVEVMGANLFDIKKVVTGTNIINNGDSIHVITTPTSSAVTASLLKDYAPNLKAGKKYTINAKTTGADKYIYLYGAKKIWNFGTSIELTEDMINGNVLWYASGIETEADISDIIINLGETPLPYEKYKQPQTVTITSDRPITKWDKLIKQDGVWGWLYKSSEYKISGNEDMLVSGGYIAISTALNADINLRGEALCNIAKNELKPYGENVFWIESGGMNARLSLTDIQTIEELKEYAKSNDIKIIYAKSNTEFVPLPQEEQTMLNALHTNNPTTIVQNSIGTDVTLTYKTKRSLEVTQ